MLVLLAADVALLRLTDLPSLQVYRVGDWQAPFGIVLVADRLSAMMVLLATVLGFAALLFSLAHWHRTGPRFHPLLQFLMMGVNGAFLTGDVFNLFVFFEVLLAASYGLALYGSGRQRVREGMHYIVINLTASLLFLIGATLLYAVTGTLNFADLAARVPHGGCRRSRASGSRRWRARRRLSGEGGDVASLFLAARHLWCGERAVGRGIRHSYQGGCVCRAAHVAAAVRRGPGRIAGFGATWLMAGGMATLGFGADRSARVAGH